MNRYHSTSRVESALRVGQDWLQAQLTQLRSRTDDRYREFQLRSDETNARLCLTLLERHHRLHDRVAVGAGPLVQLLPEVLNQVE